MDWTRIGLDALTGGAYEGVLAGKKYFFDDPANEMKSAYDKAAADAAANGQKMQQFYMGREQNAENYYAPLAKMFGNTYGAGIAAPQVPKAPAATLSSLYGGSK